MKTKEELETKIAAEWDVYLTKSREALAKYCEALDPARFAAEAAALSEFKAVRETMVDAFIAAQAELGIDYIKYI